MTSSPEHARLLRLATRASVAVASLLIVTKAIAWWLSGSVSMLAARWHGVVSQPAGRALRVTPCR